MNSPLTFSVNEIARNVNPDFNMEQMLYSIEFQDIFQTFEEALTQVENMLSEIHTTFTSKMTNRDKIRVVFFHSDLFSCIDLPFLKKSQFTVDLLIESFENVIQSYKDSIVNSNNTFSANVQIQHMPLGTGRRFIPNKIPKAKKLKINNNILSANILPSIQNICNNKKSIINVYNNDNMCCLRAILIGMRYSENCSDKSVYAKPNNKEIQKDIEYFKNNLNLPSDGCGISEVQQIEAFIENYCITIIDGSKQKSRHFLYKGPKNKKFIYILYTNSHYNVITSMPAFLGRSYYCNFCNIGYDSVCAHTCSEMCKTCKQFECNK